MFRLSADRMLPDEHGHCGTTEPQQRNFAAADNLMRAMFFLLEQEAGLDVGAVEKGDFADSGGSSNCSGADLWRPESV